MLPLKGSWVQSLIGKLRLPVPHRQKKKKNGYANLNKAYRLVDY